ncbi:glycosyltransferase [Patescibacteria group bacterium]|nr:glycosyltransferase [Patescibacteria group bacterium]MCL5410145.1 glycosyltransferase [Patescibacteria group bacterium]
MINNLLNKVLLQPSPLPIRSYGSIEVIGDQLHIHHTNRGKVKSYTINLDGKDIEDKIKNEIAKISTQNHKLVAVSFHEHELHKKVASKLWVEEDIVSFLINDKSHHSTTTLERDLKYIATSFDKDNVAQIRISPENEVEITDLVSLADYQKITSRAEYSKLLSLAKSFYHRRLIYINATPQGGGVALMRHALIRLFRLLGVDAHWFVLKPNAAVFNVTKRKFHNILQGVAAADLVLNDQDKHLYNQWIKENALIFQAEFKKADVVVIDDPQPAGLIPYIKEANPQAKIIYRSHIQIETKLVDQANSPQAKTWQFIWENAHLADIFVSHPVPDFVPKDVPSQKVVYMPATTDPLDGLNKPLTDHQITYYLQLFNKLLKEESQTPLNPKKDYLIQIARFDPSKGIPDLLESYLLLTQRLAKGHIERPQLVITGNGSVDDPDRAPVFEQTLAIINSPKYKHLKNDIKVVRLPHIDQLLNTLLRKSKIALQLSIKEGFEIKITEALMKSKPVIAYRSGGMPLQVENKVTGFLAQPGNTKQVSDYLFDLLTNTSLYQHMSWAAENYYDHSLLTIPNAIRWLELSLQLLGKNLKDLDTSKRLDSPVQSI